MMAKNRYAALWALGIILIASAGTVYAQDYAGQAYDTLGNADRNAGKTFFELFPGFEASLNSTLVQIDEKGSFMKDNHWIFYVAVFVALTAILIKIWERSEAYIVNSLVGIALLIIMIHVLGAAIKVTLLKFSLVLVLGIAGLVIIFAMQYLGIRI